MLRYEWLGTVTLLGCLVGLGAGCSSETVLTVSNPFGMPPGCKQSFCDVQYDRCYEDARSGSGSSCGECSSICSGSSDPGSCWSSCLAACGSSSSLPSVDHCGRTLEACRSTNANRGCADGIAPDSVPRALPSEKPVLMPPTVAHQDACSEEEIAYFEEKCRWTRSCRLGNKTCLACLLVDESADRWGPFVRRADGRIVDNDEGCIASLGDPTCAQKVFAASECHRTACPYPDHTCSELASTVLCATEDAEATCADKLRADPSYRACFYQASETPTTYRDPVPRFFCGK